MIRTIGRGSLLTAGALLAFAAQPQTAAAQLSFSGCAEGSSSSFKVCTSADAWYSGGTLFFDATNLNQSDASSPSFGDYASATGGWHTIAAIGLGNMTKGVDYTVGTSGLSLALKYWDGTNFVDISPTQWAVDAASIQIQNTGTSTDGHKEGIVGGYDPGPMAADHLQTTNGRFARFAISGFTGMTFSSTTSFEWHSRQVAYENCTSITSECATANSLKGNVPPTNVVPEPISMALLGTGLAGLGLARRRRRSGDVENE